MNIVSTNISYNSNVLSKNLNLLLRSYPFLNVQTVGNSVLGKPIYVVKLGRGPKKIFYSASIHANEWITTTVLMKFIEDYCISYVNRSTLYGYSVRNLYNSVSIYIMPMVNPDGVDLVTGNLAVTSPSYQKALYIANQFPSVPFPDGWKANINGVTLINFHFFIFKK
jgi:g-D-glutamyl-meso-diaminopimelate peptidase